MRKFRIYAERERERESQINVSCGTTQRHAAHKLNEPLVSYLCPLSICVLFFVVKNTNPEDCHYNNKNAFFLLNTFFYLIEFKMEF
jgi:hypothetical protein